MRKCKPKYKARILAGAGKQVNLKIWFTYAVYIFGLHIKRLISIYYIICKLCKLKSIYK